MLTYTCLAQNKLDIKETETGSMYQFTTVLEKTPMICVTTRHILNGSIGLINVSFRYGAVYGVCCQ